MRRVSEAVKADVRKRKSKTLSAKRSPDLNRAGHLCGHSLQLKEAWALAGRGGAGNREAS